MKQAIYCCIISFIFIITVVGCHSGAVTEADDGSKESDRSAAAVVKSSFSAATTNSSEEEISLVKVTPVAPIVFDQSLELSGKTLAKRESTLSLSVPGMVKEIKVNLGDKVKKDDVLLKLDRENFVLSVQQAEAALAGALAQDDLLQNETVRLNRLVAENAAPTASIDELTAQKKGTGAQVQIAETNLAKAQKALKDSVLRAPFAGVVSTILIEKGEQSHAMPPTMLMTIVDTSTLEVQVFVPEEASSKVKVGDKATVTIDSAGIVTEGAVIFVANTISQGARTFEVRVEVDNTEQEIKAGAFARVNLHQQLNSEVIFVPIAAVLRDDAQQPFVYKASGNIAHKQMVKLGKVEGTRVAVTEGLQKGDGIIVSNTGSVTDGQHVRPLKR